MTPIFSSHFQHVIQASVALNISPGSDDISRRMQPSNDLVIDSRHHFTPICPQGRPEMGTPPKYLYF